jgi:hypothetical protein
MFIIPTCHVSTQECSIEKIINQNNINKIMNLKFESIPPYIFEKMKWMNS